MTKGITGAALRHWIDDVYPNISDLQKKLNLKPSTYYDLYKKESIPWKVVAKIHAIMREDYVYDITKYFPDFERLAGHLVPETQNDSVSNAYLRNLKRDNELLQAKVIDLSEKLNQAYEKIINGTFDKMLEEIRENTNAVQQLVNTFGK